MKKHVLLFNKVSKEFFATVSNNSLDSIDDNFFTTKVVEFDDTTHEWDGGNLDNGKIVPSDSILPQITETTLDIRCGRTIESEYKPHHQFNIIIDVLSEIIEKENLSSEAIDKFITMRDYIGQRKMMNERYKSAFSSNPNFIYNSKKDEQDKYNKMFDGGLAEKISKINERNKQI